MIPKSQVTRQLLDHRRAAQGAAGTLRLFQVSGGGWAGRIDCRAAVCFRPGGHAGDASMTADDDHPFDPRATSCIGMGIVTQTFWQLPGVLRSDSPPSPRLARRLPVSPPHPVDVPHGLDSPVGQVYELDGQVLLLGVDHTANTTIHLGEYMRRARYRRKKYVTLLKRAAYPGSITLRLITARTSALSMAGWKAKGCSAAGRWAARRRAGPIERCDPGGHGKNSTERDRLSPSLRRG